MLTLLLSTSFLSLTAISFFIIDWIKTQSKTSKRKYDINIQIIEIKNIETHVRGREKTIIY